MHPQYDDVNGYICALSPGILSYFLLLRHVLVLHRLQTAKFPLRQEINPTDADFPLIVLTLKCFCIVFLCANFFLSWRHLDKR